MKAKSSRHHYLPRFLINGFTNQDGFLYVYDKEKNEISKRQKPPKSIFYEFDRNTLNLNTQESTSLIEDIFFQELDNIFSPLLKRFQEDEITRELINGENKDYFLLFIVNLFWRLPSSDLASKYLIDNADITFEKAIGERKVTKTDILIKEKIDRYLKGEKPKNFSNVEVSKIKSKLKKSGNLYKMFRPGLGNETISQYLKSPLAELYPKSKISEFKSDSLIIGDSPILYRSIPYKFTHLSSLDYMFAVSTKRIYQSSYKRVINYDDQSNFEFNVSIINQSKKYVASGNLRLLEDSVRYYHLLKEKNKLLLIKSQLFRK